MAYKLNRAQADRFSRPAAQVAQVAVARGKLRGRAAAPKAGMLAATRPTTLKCPDGWWEGTGEVGGGKKGYCCFKAWYTLGVPWCEKPR